MTWTWRSHRQGSRPDVMRCARAREMAIDGARVLVACLDDIIASKEAAGRDQDFEALPRLIHLQRTQQAHPDLPDGRP